MSDLIWCEACRDHYDRDHYDDDGDHGVGGEWGWAGYSAACVQAVAKLRELAVEHGTEATDGSTTDASEIWSTEILDLLPSEEIVKPHWLQQQERMAREATP